ncbi:MAG: hypothetical protein U1E76_12945 [Planctomycetota bacterium]
MRRPWYTQRGARTDTTLMFEVSVIEANDDGQVSRDGAVASGHWHQGAHSWPLELRRP